MLQLRHAPRFARENLLMTRTEQQGLNIAKLPWSASYSSFAVSAYFRKSCGHRDQWPCGFQDSRIDGPRRYFRQSLTARTRKNPCQSRFATQVAPYDTFSILRPS